MVKGLVSLVFIAVIVGGVVVGIVNDETPPKESPVTVDAGIIDQVDIVSDVGIGILDPKDVGLEYHQQDEVGYMLLGVDKITGDYKALRMDVQGYILCKDVNKEIFKLVPKE